MSHREVPSPFDVAAYVREMSSHLAAMAEQAQLMRLASALEGAAWIAAEEAGRLAQASARKAAADDAP